jgi:hypothetical protein
MHQNPTPEASPLPSVITTAIKQEAFVDILNMALSNTNDQAILNTLHHSQSSPSVAAQAFPTPSAVTMEDITTILSMDLNVELPQGSHNQFNILPLSPGPDNSMLSPTTSNATLFEDLLRDISTANTSNTLLQVPSAATVQQHSDILSRSLPSFAPLAPGATAASPMLPVDNLSHALLSPPASFSPSASSPMLPLASSTMASKALLHSDLSSSAALQLLSPVSTPQPTLHDLMASLSPNISVHQSQLQQQQQQLNSSSLDLSSMHFAAPSIFPFVAQEHPDLKDFVPTPWLPPALSPSPYDAIMVCGAASGGAEAPSGGRFHPYAFRDAQDEQARAAPELHPAENGVVVKDNHWATSLGPKDWKDRCQKTPPTSVRPMTPTRKPPQRGSSVVSPVGFWFLNLHLTLPFF